MEIPLKTKGRIILSSNNTTTGYGSKEHKSLHQRDTCTSMFSAALLTIAKTCYQPRGQSMEEWIRSVCHMYTVDQGHVPYVHNALLFSHNKKWNLVIWNNMHGIQGHCVSEVRQTRKTSSQSLWNLNLILWKNGECKCGKCVGAGSGERCVRDASTQPERRN
jgi:hypothetical protein